MEIKLNVRSFRPDERIALSLRSVYESFGYRPYKMSKFEEYELYSSNIDFLGDGGVLTFTDVNGKLMALKPDVTLSIVKNSKGNKGTQKVHYRENVYRRAVHGGGFKEILQSGIECIGNIGRYEITEVLLLALKSLETTGRPFRLDISHMGILSSLVDEDIPSNIKDELFTCIKRKNADGIKELCVRSSLDLAHYTALIEAVSLNGTPDCVIASLKSICVGAGLTVVLELEKIINTLSSLGYGENIGIDLSVVNDMNYYRSLVFRGYIDCVPEGILFGGRYDDLMNKMGRDCGALGFAVALDKLEDIAASSENDTCAVLLYPNDASPSEIIMAAESIRKTGLTVEVIPENENINNGRRVFRLLADGTVIETEADNA